MSLMYTSNSYTIFCQITFSVSFPPLPMTKNIHFPAVSESRKYPKVPEFLGKVPVSIRKYLQVPTG